MFYNYRVKKLYIILLNVNNEIKNYKILLRCEKWKYIKYFMNYSFKLDRSSFLNVWLFGFWFLVFFIVVLILNYVYMFVFFILVFLSVILMGFCFRKFVCSYYITFFYYIIFLCFIIFLCYFLIRNNFIEFIIYV